MPWIIGKEWDIRLDGRNFEILPSGHKCKPSLVDDHSSVMKLQRYSALCPVVSSRT